LIKAKEGLLESREEILEMALHRWGIGIKHMYAGSAFFSGMQLMAKAAVSLSIYVFLKPYIYHPLAMEAIRTIPNRGSFKVVLPLLLFKYRMHYFLFLCLTILRKLNIKII